MKTTYLSRFPYSRYPYTGVNTGTATLTITSRAKTAKGKKLQAKLDVTVINPFKVTQTGAYTFTMSTADKLEKVDKRDVKVTQEGNTVDNAVKSVKLSEDKMSVEVTMEIPFVDQQKYNVEFGKEKDSFVASVGAPAAINIKTQTVVINKPTKIEYAVVDEKGMDVTDVIDAAKLSVEVTAKTGHYDLVSKKLSLWRVGDTAEVKVTYHSWTYDAKTGKENVIEGKGTITCVDKSAVTVVGLDKWTIADRVLSWDTDEMKTVIAQGESSRIFVRMKKSDGTYVNNKDNAADFTFDPITTATLYVYADGSIYATREGMEYAKVTYFDGLVKYQYTLPITVGAAAKATTVVLNPQFVVIDAKAGAPVTMGLKVLDQYGNELELDSSRVMIDSTKPLSGKKVAIFAYGTFSKINKILPVLVSPINPGTPEIGTGVYKLTYKDVKGNEVSASFTVNAQDLGKVNGHLLKADYNDFDISVHDQTKTDELDALADGIEIKVFDTKNGIPAANNTTFAGAGATIKINGEKVIPAPGTMLEEAGGVLTFKPVVKDKANNYVLLVPRTGGYRIEVTNTVDGKPVTISTYINVTNTTKAPEFDKSYTLNKVEAGTVGVATAVNQVVRNLLTGGASLEHNDRYANKILHKAAEWDGTAIVASADAYYLDTATLPSFKTEGGDFIWMTQDKLNKKLEIKTLAKFEGADKLNVEKKADTFFNTQKDDNVDIVKTVTLSVTGEFLENTSTLVDQANTKGWHLEGHGDKYKLNSVRIKETTNPVDGKGYTKAILEAEVALIKTKDAALADSGNVKIKYIDDKQTLDAKEILEVKATPTFTSLAALAGNVTFVTTDTALTPAKALRVKLVGTNLHLIKNDAFVQATYEGTDGTHGSDFKFEYVSFEGTNDAGTEAYLTVNVSLKKALANSDEAKLKITLLGAVSEGLALNAETAAVVAEVN